MVHVATYCLPNGKTFTIEVAEVAEIKRFATSQGITCPLVSVQLLGPAIVTLEDGRTLSFEQESLRPQPPRPAKTQLEQQMEGTIVALAGGADVRELGKRTISKRTRRAS